MYQIYADSYLLYDPRVANTDDKYILIDPTLTLAVGSAGSLTFSIYNSHPNIDKVKRMSAVIEVKRDSTPIFRGRVVRDTLNFRGAHAIEVEGMGACLNDSIQEPFDFPADYVNEEEYKTAVTSGNVVQYFLKVLLTNHNDQVSDNQKVTLGNVTVSDLNNYIARSSEDAATTWDTLDDKLTGTTLGGYLVFRYETDGTYLDYISTFATENTQVIELSSNLLDLSDETYGGDMYNAIYPVGKDKLTISSLVDGTYSGYIKEGNVIYDADKVSRYGRITKLISWDDVTIADNLLSKAVTMLQDESGVLPKTLSVNAVDLNYTGEYDPLSIAKKATVITQYGTDTYPVMSITENLINPSQTNISLSKESETYTDELQKRQSNINIVINDIKGTASETKEELQNRLTTTETELKQASDTITALAQRIDALNTQLTEVSQTADGLNVRITKITTSGVDKVTTSTGYTFNQDGLIITKSGSEMQNKLDNSGLYVTRSGVSVLTANNEGVEALNLTANQYLTIGDNSRFEDFDNGTDHYRTAAFYVGTNW